MGRRGIIFCALLMLCPLALSRHDDDFAFDNGDEFQVELTMNHSEIEKNGLKRLWGVPDTSAYVGHLFRMEIPKEAFSGEVLSYKVRTEEGRQAPSWLAVDTKHGLLSGLPLEHDLGANSLTVTAYGRTEGLTAKDTFTVHVKKAEEKPHSKYGTCIGSENRLVLVVLVDGAFHRIQPRQRIRALMEISHFMALDGDEFSMAPYKSESDRGTSVLMSGIGSSRRRTEATTAIYLNVGCGEKLWSRHKVLVGGVREQSRDGTLGHLLKLPVIGWRLLSVKPQPRSKRQSPITDGSGDYDDDYGGEDDAGDYSGYDDGDDGDYRTGDDVPENVDALPPYTPYQTPPTPPHPHRHHHGETTTQILQNTPGDVTTTVVATNTNIVQTTTPNIISSSPSVLSTNPPEPTTAHSQVTEVMTVEEESTLEPAANNAFTAIETTEDSKIKITPYSESSSESTNLNFSIVPFNFKPRVYNPETTLDETEDPDDMLPTTTESDSQTVIIRDLPTSSSTPLPSPSPVPSEASTYETSVPPPTVPTTLPTTMATEPTILPVTVETVTTSSTTTSTTTTESAPPVVLTTEVETTPVETTVEDVTKQDEVTSSERSSTIIGRTTETVTFALPVNQPPTLKHHMKKLPITAGKAFRYVISPDLFTDPEDGSNLTFTLSESDGAPLGRNSWIQFIPSEREVYGLPLESHVSRWNFVVEAKDSEGLKARGPLDIIVQQHKGARTINHEFALQFKLNKQYQNSIDWEIRALEGIVNLFRDTDMDRLTVLNATISGDMCEIVWTNDTLPKDTACPIDDINRLMKIMEDETESGNPSAALTRAMQPELKVSSVSWRGRGICVMPTTKAAPTEGPRDTYPPVTRNQVDIVTASQGHLLVYKVPQDTFYDPEDGDTRNLALTLRFSDRNEIPSTNWLQFDNNNQEFYGLPLSSELGTSHYQLIAEDSSKKSAYDSLMVEVVKAPTIRPTVEFQMTMEYPYNELAYNAKNQRRIVEKLAALFGQKETDNIRIQSISDNPTTIIWYNTSLPMDRCPKKEIEELRKMIIVDERGSTGGALKDNVDQIFDKALKVMSIRLIPLGLCADQNTKSPKIVPPSNAGTNLQNSKDRSAADGYTEYLVTFIIPAVVIVCMIFVAGIIACVLYRRRKTGKMSVGDEEERQAFRSKGIPVIFQDELEERADSEPVHKSPVIMREEKPPLLPPAPDYRSDEAPYRPPPPFAASRTPPRPKATPTYRKPPPYVPP